MNNDYMKKQIIEICKGLTDEEFRKVISNVKKKLVKKDSVFSGGVIIRNPGKRTENMKNYYRFMIDLSNKRTN